MDGYSEADEHGDSKIWRQMRLRFVFTILALYKFVCMYVSDVVRKGEVFMEYESEVSNRVYCACFKSCGRFR